MPTFIDLFCGCGGFSLGMKWAGFDELAAIDFNPESIIVFSKNFSNINSKILEKDLLTYEPSELEQTIGKQNVDVIIGGPPCQGFSTVRQRDGSNSGRRIIHDERRELYQVLLRYVKYFKPKIFVMENVLGIRSASGGLFFNKVQSEAREIGYRVHGQIIKAWEYGVPQKRERQLIIGTRLDLPLFSRSKYFPATHGSISNGKQKIVTVWEAIGDLPPVKVDSGLEISEYDQNRHIKQINRYTGRYLYDVLEVDKTDKLTMHRARYHSKRDLRDFKKLHEGETSAHAIARGEKMEFPYDKESFKDRYTKQHRNSLCSTIVAHLSKDGLMFIHPTQNRSLTPREAARIQSFPDWFQFPVARTHQFRLIGNAVPPLVGKVVGLGIIRWLHDVDDYFERFQKQQESIDIDNALIWLKDFVENMANGRLAKMPKDQFIKGWIAISYFFNHLHPDSAMENGNEICTTVPFFEPRLEKIEAKLISPTYERSGWPVFLVKIVNEAYYRLSQGELSQDEYYCSNAHISGYEYLKAKNYGK